MNCNGTVQEVQGASFRHSFLHLVTVGQLPQESTRALHYRRLPHVRAEGLPNRKPFGRPWFSDHGFAFNT